MFSPKSRQAPTGCPVCATPLRIARLQCNPCHSALEGDFAIGRLGRLSREQQAFAEVFRTRPWSRASISWCRPWVPRRRLRRRILAPGASTICVAALARVADGSLSPRAAHELLRAIGFA